MKIKPTLVGLRREYGSMLSLVLIKPVMRQFLPLKIRFFEPKIRCTLNPKPQAVKPNDSLDPIAVFSRDF